MLGLGLDLTTVYVSDVDRAVGWWTGPLGWVLRRDETVGPGMRFTEVGPAAGGAGVALAASYPGAPPAQRPGGFTGVVLGCAALGATLTALRAAGLDVRETAPGRGPSPVAAVVLDPDGNALGLRERA